MDLNVPPTEVWRNRKLNSTRSMRIWEGPWEDLSVHEKIVSVSSTACRSSDQEHQIKNVPCHMCPIRYGRKGHGCHGRYKIQYLWTVMKSIQWWTTVWMLISYDHQSGEDQHHLEKTVEQRDRQHTSRIPNISQSLTTIHINSKWGYCNSFPLLDLACFCRKSGRNRLD